LCCLSAKKWLKPLALPNVAALTNIARIADARWLVTRRTKQGNAYAAVYSPLHWEVRRIGTPRGRALLDCAGQPGKEIDLAAGADGAIVWARPHGNLQKTMPGGRDISTMTIDPAGRGLAAAAGRIWVHQRRAPLLDATNPPEGRWE